jgi:hypothetical protein
MCMSRSVSRCCLSLILFIPTATDRLARNITVYYTVHMFRPLNLAAIRSSTYTKNTEKFIMIYHHNRNYHHHACKDLNLVAVPVSTLQSRCLSNGRHVFPFPAGWYFITACTCLDLPILLTRCIHLPWQLLTCTKTCSVLNLLQNTFICFVLSDSVYFKAFLNNVISAALIRDLSCPCSVQFSISLLG